MGTYIAYAYFEFRDKGDVVLPVLGLPERIHVLPTPTLAASLAYALVLSALVGLAVYWLVFRPLRSAHALARVVASLGLFLYFQEITRLRFPTAGATAVVRFPILPEDTVHVLGTGVSANRLILAGLVLAVTAILTLVFQHTRFGLATRAAAVNEKGAVLTGISPDRVGAVNWMVASVLAGFAVILIEPIAGLDPTTTSLFVVPALAAALLGGLASFGLTAAAGLGIGMVQSLILGYAVRPDTTWIPGWVPVTGLQQAVPVVLVLATLAWRGDPLPTRSTLVERALPPSPTPRRVSLWSGLLATATVVGLYTFEADLRQALIVSLVYTFLTLSTVVITGYVGQISLAQMAFAGVAGFTAIEVADNGLPFPLAMAFAVAVATGVGLVVGVPALRVRGMSLAVATMASAVAIEQLVLGSSALSAPVPVRHRRRDLRHRLGQLPPRVRHHRPRGPRGGVPGGREPAQEPHGAPLARRAGQRAGGCRGGHRRRPRQARRVRRLVRPRRALRGVHRLRHLHAVHHVLHGYRGPGGRGHDLPGRHLQHQRRRARRSARPVGPAHHHLQLGWRRAEQVRLRHQRPRPGGGGGGRP
jgi:branched-chain amino acid transport system permease protein